MMTAGDTHEHLPLLLTLDEGLLGAIFSTYLDFKSLVNFTIVISGSIYSPTRIGSSPSTKTNEKKNPESNPPLRFPRLNLTDIHLGLEAAKVTQSSMHLVRRHYNVQGITFDLGFPDKEHDFENDDHWDVSPTGSPRLRRTIMPSFAEQGHRDQFRRVIIRRIPFLISNLDGIVSLKIQVQDANGINISHLCAVFKDIANMLQAGFCSKLEYVQVPGMKHCLAEEIPRINPTILRMLISASTDDVLPHPLSDDFFDQPRQPLAPRTFSDQERNLHGAIELLFYHLPTSKSRQLFARQLFAEDPNVRSANFF